MKKLYFSLLGILFFNLGSCKNNIELNVNEEELSQIDDVEVTQDNDSTTTAKYSLKKANTTLGWTAYKATEKIPVNGIFKKIIFNKDYKGNSMKEAIDNTEFTVPVESIFSSLAIRDNRIKDFFFGIMNDTDFISGKLMIHNDSIGYVDLTMNELTNRVAFKYTIDEKTFNLNGKIDLLDWDSQEALDSLNVVCKYLHMGADGITKTWSEVDLHAITKFE